MNLVEILRRQSEERGTAPAILERRRWRDRAITFAGLELASAQAARLLRANGLQPGDSVLIFQPVSIELYVALLALFRLGLTAMFLDPSAGRQHIERCCALHPPQALIAADRACLLCLLSPALRRIRRKFVVGWPLPGICPWSRYRRLQPDQDIVACAADTPALLTFTSGSTGLPKAALRTHGFLLTQHRILAQHFHLQAGQVDLATLPIVLLANLASGVTSVIPDADLRYPGAVAPGPILRQIDQLAVASSVASPAFFERLTRECSRTRRTLPTLRRLFTGGAPVFPRLLEQMQQMAPPADVEAVYGSTEAEPIAHVSLRDVTPADQRAMLEGRGLLAGRPIPEIQLRILRDQWGTPLGPFTPPQFDAECQPPGQPGEIVVSGEHVLTGYLHGHGDQETKFQVLPAAKTETAPSTVWHRTGDAGYLDVQGRVWLLGRCSARLHDARGELYPFAVETALYQNSQVRRAALVSHQEQRVLVVEFFEARHQANVEELRRLVSFAPIDEVRVLRRIPVDGRHNAKIDYPALHKLLGS